MIRATCERFHKRPMTASVCVIWDRTLRYLANGIDIRHVHLCGTHANMEVQDVERGDNWAERTLAECEASNA